MYVPIPRSFMHIFNIFLRVLFLAFVQQKYKKIFQKIKEMKCEMRLPAAQFVIMGIIN